MGEFTVIIEPVAGKGVVARVAEVPAVTAEAASPVEACRLVAARLLEHFEKERARTLRRLKRSATVGV
jgi:hypothetical protein